jgi:hypothetical protein
MNTNKGPRVHQLDAAALEVAGVAGGHAGAMSAGDRGDLAIELADGATSRTPHGGDGGIGAGSLAVEGQDAVAKVFLKNALDRLGVLALSSVWAGHQAQAAALATAPAKA